MVETFVGLVAGVLAGLVITLFFSRRATAELRTATESVLTESSELRRETVRLRHMVNTLARALEEAKVITVTWDEERQLSGVKFLREVGGNQVASRGDLELQPIMRAESSDAPNRE